MTAEWEWNRRRRLNRYVSLVRPVMELTGKWNVPYPIGTMIVAAGVDTEQDIRSGRVLGWLVVRRDTGLWRAVGGVVADSGGEVGHSGRRPGSRRMRIESLCYLGEMESRDSKKKEELREQNTREERNTWRFGVRKGTGGGLLNHRENEVASLPNS